MPSSQQLLDQAPQEGIAALHASRFGREGLVQRSRIRSEVESWLADSSRIADALARMPAADPLATAIHLAGPLGIPFDAFPDSAGESLDLLASEFLIVLDDNDPPSWCPLSDLTPWFFREWIASMPPRLRPQGQKGPARAFLEGLACLTASIDAGKARLNRDGSLNRRDRPALREHFSHLAPFGEQAMERALDLALEILGEQELLLQKDGRLETAPSTEAWLAKADTDPRSILRWWTSRHPATSDLVALLSPHVDQGLPGPAMAELFLRREGSFADPGKSVQWTALPDTLKQALAIGLLEFESIDSNLQHAWLGVEHHTPKSERCWWCTSDFQLFLAPDAPLGLHRAAEFMGERIASDLVSRYRINREAILSGAAFPAWGEQLPQLIENLAPPRAVAFQLEEWLASRRACLFDSIRVLRVPDARRHAELAALDSFAAHVLETIPGWGFVLDPTDEPHLRKLLATLGYDPPTDPSPSGAEPWRSPESVTPPREAPPEDSWQWPSVGAPPRRAQAGSGSRYAVGTPKELDYPDILRLVEYAALTECEIDVVLKGQSQRVVRMRAERIDKRKEPVSLEARLLSTGERRDLPLDSIRRIALAGS